MNSNRKTVWILFFAVMFFFGFSVNSVPIQDEHIAGVSSDGPGENEVGYVIPFAVVNKLDPNATIVFGRYSLLTQRLEGNYYFRTGNSDSVLFHYPVQYLDVHDGVYLETPLSRNRFSETTLDLPVYNVVKAYCYPPNSISLETIIYNLQNKKDTPGTIVVYEMNETLGTMTH